MTQIQKVTGIDDGNTEPGVVSETSSNSVSVDIRIQKIRAVGNERWKLIDSNVTNARKCLEVKQYESLQEERTYEIFVEINKGIKEE